MKELTQDNALLLSNTTEEITSFEEYLTSFDYDDLEFVHYIAVRDNIPSLIYDILALNVCFLLKLELKRDIQETKNMVDPQLITQLLVGIIGERLNRDNLIEFNTTRKFFDYSTYKIKSNVVKSINSRLN